jgi:CRISPR-associated endonuclease/helicase Cas3
MEQGNIAKVYYRYWGKARRKEDGSYEYHPLPYHCLDVAAVGKHLLQPGARRNTDISLQTGFSPETVQYLFVSNLLLHDLGKFSTSFQAVIVELFRKLFPDKETKRYEERHDTLGYVLWRGVIKNTVTDKNLADLLDILIKTGFGHHGIPPKESAQHGNALFRAQNYFDQNDKDAAGAYTSESLTLLNRLPVMSEIDMESKQKLKYASWQFSGLAILADWVGSNSTIFSYPVSNSYFPSLQEYWENYAIPRAAEAVAAIEWKERAIRPFSGITDLFPFISTATPLQKHVTETEMKPGPKLWILEDLTGAGKTEAAIILAQRMMVAGDADGLYIGLPTMATANAMYERLQKAYERLYVEGEKPSLVLSHGMRHLSEKFQKSVGLPTQTDDVSYGEEENARSYCNEWIADSRKKALLADVGVGTIDQAILGILPARHQSLRLAGLHRKILIVDEVHAYDTYVEHLLGVLLEAHARNGGSVILLSATIPKRIRKKLIAAFQVGLDVPNEEDEISDIGFPLVTQVAATGIGIWPEPSEVRHECSRKMGIEFLHEKGNVFNKIIKVAFEGQCVCWIRNTVEDARKAFYELLKRGIEPDKIDLFHSRFAMIDRSRIENAASYNFGKKSGSTERTGRILIATQVVEQSLDLDFDVMISDLAPIDLLIQRAGRIHRHARYKNGLIKTETGASDERSAPSIAIYAPEFLSKPNSSWLSGEFKGTAAVYKHIGRLWITQKILKEKTETGGWSMPDDARTLIESVYGETAETSIPDSLQKATIRAEGEEQAKEGMGHLSALILKKGYCRGAVRVDQWNEDDKVQTRLSEENHEIALAVSRNGILLPYADLKEHAWDWSMLSVSRAAWNRIGYTTPQKYTVAVEELKKKLPRLKYCEIVIVTEQSNEAFSSNKTICDYYSPRYGWGASLEEEE